MQTIRTLLLMKHNGMSDQQVADALKIAKGSVNTFFNRYKSSRKGLPVPQDLTDIELRDIIYPPKPIEAKTPDLDWTRIESKLSQPGLTLQLLWEDYQKDNPGGLGRSSFYASFRRYRKQQNISMVILHKGGEELFFDYSGDGLSYIDRQTGEEIPLQVFVSAWGASGYAFVDVTRTQSSEDWAMSHVRALEYYGCVSALFIPDNLKAGVLKPDFYEPTLNPVYAKLAEHYGASIVPARVRRPKDKAVVESCVLQVQRRVLAPLREKQFFSMEDAREAVLEQLETFNSRPMKDHEGQSRKERFDALDKPHAKALPQERFSISAIHVDVLVQKNYHVPFAGHYYSIPYVNVGKRVDIHQVNGVIEIYLDGSHLCRHAKSTVKGGYTTTAGHMPANHAFAKGISPAWLIFKAGEIGPLTSSAVKNMLEQRRHPEQAYRSALGVLGLAKGYGSDRVEAACTRALHFGSVGYRQVKSILESGLDREGIGQDNKQTLLTPHSNIRGPEYYASSEQGGI